MSFLGSLWNDVKGVGHTVGSVLSNPLVDAGLSFIPGVGWIGAGIAGLAGGLLKPGGNVGTGIAGGLEGGAAGAGAQYLRNAIGSGNYGNILKSIPILGSVLGASGAGGAGGAGGGLGGGLGGLGGLATLGLGGLDLASATQLGGLSQQNAKDALASSVNSYNSRQPLRQAGISGMLNPQIPNLTGLMGNSGPYAAGLPTPTRTATGATPYSGVVS